MSAQRFRAIGSWTETRHLGISLFIVLMLASGYLSSLAPPSDPTAPTATRFLALQQQALLPGYQDEATLTDLPRYRIVATVDLTQALIQGQQEVRFPNTTSEPLGEAVFRLLANARSIYGGGSIEVVRASRNDDGVPLQPLPAEDATVLRLPLEPPLAPGEWATLHLTFAAKIPVRSSGYAIFYHSAQITTLTAWYPVLAPLGAGWEVAPMPGVGDANHFAPSLYDVSLRLSAGYEVVSSGVTVERQPNGDAEVWHLVSGPSRGFAVAISNRFVHQQTERDGVTINYYALPPVAGANHPDEALAIAADALSAYIRRFGPYPYTEFDVVETPVSIGGYEFPGMVFVEHSLRTRGAYSQLRFIVAHETAHQWWFALVGSNPVAEPWLDESLATYATAIYLEEAQGAGAAQGMIGYFRQEGGGAGRGAPILSPATAFGSWAAYRSPVYYRGALFLHALRGELGEEAFGRLLRTYVERYRFRTARTGDLLRLAEEVAGRELDDLYRTWFGTEEPGG